MSCFVPYQLTNLSKCILISRTIVLRTDIMKLPSDPSSHTASDCSLNRVQHFPEKGTCANCRKSSTFMPATPAPIIIYLIKTPAETPAIIKPRMLSVRMFIGIHLCSVLLDISLISAFSRPDKSFFEVFPLYEPLALLEPLVFPLELQSPSFPCSFLCQHSKTMTCSVYRSCHCLCVESREQCSLSENELHCT